MWDRFKKVHPFWWFAGLFVLINALWIIPNFATGRGLGKGSHAPAFSLADISEPGRTISLDQMRGSAVLLLFWATWCDACMAEIPTVRAVQERFASRGLVVLGMNVDGGDPHSVRGFLERGTIPWRNVAVDDVTAGAYRVRLLPALYIVDREGTICRGFSGRVGERRLARAVESCL